MQGSYIGDNPGMPSVPQFPPGGTRRSLTASCSGGVRFDGRVLIFAAAATSARTEEQAVDGHPLLALGAARSDADCPVPLAAEGEVEGPGVAAELGDAAESVTTEIETTMPDRTGCQ